MKGYFGVNGECQKIEKNHVANFFKLWEDWNLHIWNIKL